MVSHAARHRARHRFPKRPRALRQAEGEKPPDSAGFETGAFESLESDFQEVRPQPHGCLLLSVACPRGCLLLSAFTLVRRHASQVLQELVGDKSLERFRSEYEKLHRALKKSHESEKRLIKKCRELNQVRAWCLAAPAGGRRWCVAERGAAQLTRPRCCAPQEIVANAATVQTALKLSQEDQNTIASLKKEIEKAWKMVDASHEKEQRAKETIQ